MDGFTFVVMDVRNSISRRVPLPPNGNVYLGVFGDRLMARTAEGEVYLTDLDGMDRDVLVTTTSNIDIRAVDIAPEVLRSFA